MASNDWISGHGIVLFFFIVLFLGVLHGLKTGRTVLLLQKYDKSTDPAFYWAGTVIASLAAVALLAVLVFG